ncbi:uncharacterized protein UV8b_07430 [Ustilaginoidea virens]|uniref:Exoribonuclease phosphorolytic domain-containing protein n=1 Tax=Ustilaginoidea virens TaxID=1159556 RepID=A0A1B5L2V7_USTVR|nr:uncharacterized protein UV8b_07430 [Ustilaginoidea virens]QUC23189.1 hypothetical protein UV8b_07430 [Ustilaginoidea virens]GAO17755.1 hypothetical protein UVI_02033560 [Ustilaginoidea virens]
MSDRRRVNGPPGITCSPSYDENSSLSLSGHTKPSPLYLKTGVTPSASGSAYLEMDQYGMKLTCTVHGPRSLPRSAPFSPHMVLSTFVKYAPFATKSGKGYLRDANERDLSMHLETALRGAIIAERWPKSGVDVVVTVIEGDLAHQSIPEDGHEDWDSMTVLGGCITVASAAIADAGIDCADTITGGVAAIVMDSGLSGEPFIVHGPMRSKNWVILAVCCVAYMTQRNDVTNLWYKGCLSLPDPSMRRSLIARAISVCKGMHETIIETLCEAVPLV